MDKLYAVTLTDLEDTNPCKTWIFDNKKTAYMFLCNKYEKSWKKYYIPDSKGKYDVVEKKSIYPFVDGYKNKDFLVGEYYNIYFKNGTEIIYGICQVAATHINISDKEIDKDYLSYLDPDICEAVDMAEQMLKDPDKITLSDIIWLCRKVGMGKEILNATEGTWLKVTEDALRKLGYRI